MAEYTKSEKRVVKELIRKGVLLHVHVFVISADLRNVC